VESERIGHGADRLLFEITAVDEKTIRRGREELASSLCGQTCRSGLSPALDGLLLKKKTYDRRHVAGTGRT